MSSVPDHDSSVPSRRRQNLSAAATGFKPNAGNTGNRILKPGVPGVEMWSLSGGKPTTIRILPTPNYEDETRATSEPYRLSAADTDFGSWIQMYPVVRFFSNKLLTFVAYDPNNHNYDPATNPVSLIFQAYLDAEKRKHPNFAEWHALAKKGSDSDYGVLKPIDTIGLVQCCLMRAWMKDKDRNELVQEVFAPPRGYRAEHPLVVLQMPNTAVKALYKELNRRKEGVGNASGTDWEKMFVHGDPIDLTRGRFVTLFQKKFASLVDGNTAAPVEEDMPTGFDTPERPRHGRGGNEGSRQENQSYDVRIDTSFMKIRSAAFSPEAIDNFRKKARYWDEIIHIPSHEQIVEWIADEKAFPPTLIMSALEERYGKLIPARVRMLCKPDLYRGGWEAVDPRDLVEQQEAPRRNTMPARQQPVQSTRQPAPAARREEDDLFKEEDTTNGWGDPTATEPVEEAAPTQEQVLTRPAARQTLARPADAVGDGDWENQNTSETAPGADEEPAATTLTTVSETEAAAREATLAALRRTKEAVRRSREE